MCRSHNMNELIAEWEATQAIPIGSTRRIFLVLCDSAALSTDGDLPLSRKDLHLQKSFGMNTTCQV